MEGRLAHKRKTLASAQERVEQAQRTVEEAQAGLEFAKKESKARSEELQALEQELADLPKEPAATDSRAFDAPELPHELAGDQEAQEAIAVAKAAAEAADKLLEAKLAASRVDAAKGAAHATCTAERDDGIGGMEFDDDSWLEGDSLAFVKEQRAAMGNDKFLQLETLLKGKGKGVRAGPYG